jgi:GntR family transcriptional repressor for pyruvate dehydrogenase complex
MRALVPHGVERLSAAESVRAQIQSAIESGDLKRGEKLPSEKELAALFSVSRPVVREALGSLRAVGLIFSRSGRGSFVARTAPLPILLQGRYSLDELHEIRLLLETDGAARAAERRTQDDLETLLATLEKLERCSDIEEWIRLDVAFHRGLGEATRNQLSARLVGYLQDLLVEQARVVLTVAGRIVRADEEHRAIYNAVQAADPRAARHAMYLHLRNSYTELVAELQGHS